MMPASGVLERTVDVQVEIRIPEVIVEHSYRNLEVVELRLLVRTVLSKSWEKAKVQRVSRKWNAMEERYVGCLSSVSVGSCGAVAEWH